jgi:tricorn protease
MKRSIYTSCKLLTTAVCAITFSLNALAQVTPEWVRYPAISPNGQTIAFTYKGDLYKVPASGGEATQLTFHSAHDYMPVWSKDGEKLSFASNRFGNFDVYVMDALGGKADRLTFHSANEEPYTFSHDDRQVMFKAQRMDTAQHRQHPTGRQAELYSVPVTGGRVDQVFTLPAENVQVNKDGSEMVYQDNKGFENPWRKHHRSAITRDIWHFDVAKNEHKKLTDFKGEDRNPIFINDGKSIVYLSEEEGSFNVFRLNLNRPSSTKQLTEFELHPVRFLSEGNGTLAFGYHGDVYTMTENGKPQQVNISIRTQDIDNNQQMEDVNGDITDMDISPDGKEIVFVSHGEVFVSSADGAFTKQITHTPAQEAFVKFSPNGEYILYGASRDKKWSIYKAEKVREQEPFFYAATLIKESVFISNDKDNYQPQISPDGNKIAFIEDRKTLRVMDIESSEVTTLITADKMIHMRDGDQNFSWSPDSKWLLFQYDKLLNNSDVALVSADGSKPMQVVVQSGYYDSSPKWADDGKQIIWFSNREGLRSYATSGRSQQDVYAMFLTQQEWDKFNLSEDDYDLLQAIEEAAKEDEKESKSDDKAGDDEASDDEASDEDDAVEDIAIEWDDLDQRTSRLTIHSSNLGDAVLNKDATKLYYLSRFEDNFDLWETDLRTQETKKAIGLNARGGRLQWDDEMENLYLLSGGRIAKLDLDKGSKESVSINEQVFIDQDALREHSFEHVWLRTSKIFYEPTFHGINWPQMYNEYKPKIAHLGNAHEFTELLSEMLGELNVSHAGAGFRGSSAEGDITASLGIFFDYDHAGNGIKVSEVLKGGPLDKASIDIKPGMLITKIDGKTVEQDMDWAQLLNRKSNRFTLIEVLDVVNNATKEYTVKPISLGEQSDLLYKRFVKINEDQVLKASKGTLGYVHIPGMGDGPYRSIYDDMMGRFADKKAMVVDTRFNGGGDLVADLAMFFTGVPFLTYAIEGKVVGGEPTSRYTKPVISLFNESMYSDGHCYASGYQDLKIGKSVGMPVPGTCSFAGWESLPTGGYWGVVPVSAKNQAGEWLENNETAPDIMVKNQPGVIEKGRDEQLERAIKELLKEVR